MCRLCGAENESSRSFECAIYHHQWQRHDATTTDVVMACYNSTATIMCLLICCQHLSDRHTSEKKGRSGKHRARSWPSKSSSALGWQPEPTTRRSPVCAWERMGGARGRGCVMMCVSVWCESSWIHLSAHIFPNLNSHRQKDAYTVNCLQPTREGTVQANMIHIKAISIHLCGVALVASRSDTPRRSASVHTMSATWVSSESNPKS